MSLTSLCYLDRCYQIMVLSSRYIHLDSQNGYTCYCQHRLQSKPNYFISCSIVQKQKYKTRRYKANSMNNAWRALSYVEKIGTCRRLVVDTIQKNIIVWLQIYYFVFSHRNVVFHIITVCDNIEGMILPKQLQEYYPFYNYGIS